MRVVESQPMICRTTLALVFGVAVLAAAQGAPGLKPLYDETADARADIAKAVADGQRDHKRILLVFGGNW
jgi:hypothetical protein